MQAQSVQILLGLILILTIGGQVYFSKRAQTSLAQGVNPAFFETNSLFPSGNITLAQVAIHASRSSCWSAINGSVYDLTGWIPNHPGGEQNILKLCGQDGSALFNNQHGKGAEQARILEGFKIGTLQ